MSVPTYNRNESKVQFIDTARELVEHTLKYVHKLPKRATFYLSIRIFDYSAKVYESVVSANEYYPTTSLDIEQRKILFKQAQGYLSSLDYFLGLAKDSYGGLKNEKGNPIISEYGWVHWGELIKKEKSLIKSVLSSDSKIVL